jgi:hypothetical protein
VSTFEWIALIGAAAWVPQIISLAYRVIVKPRITVIPVPTIEISYNVLGPILNLKAALFTQRKDAIVVDMQLKLTHFKGRVIVLNWHSFVETFSELQGQAGEKAEVKRDQEATALKLSTILPTEKFIRFQDQSWQEEARRLTTAADQEFNRLKASVADAGPAFLATQAHESLVSFHKHNFCWEPGRYDLELCIQILERGSPAMARTHFELTQHEINRLRENLDMIEHQIEQIAIGSAEDEPKISTNWVNPRLASKLIMVKP